MKILVAVFLLFLMTLSLSSCFLFQSGNDFLYELAEVSNDCPDDKGKESAEKEKETDKYGKYHTLEMAEISPATMNVSSLFDLAFHLSERHSFLLEMPPEV